VAGVVFNARAITCLLQEFQIIAGALFKALGFQKFALSPQFCQPLL